MSDSEALIEQRRLSVLHAGESLDLVADAGLLVRDLVALTGVTDDVVLSRLDGRAIDPAHSLGRAGLTDGDVLVLTPVAQVPPKLTAHTDAAAPRETPVSHLHMRTVLAAVGGAVLALLTGLAAAATQDRTAALWVGAVLLGLGAVVGMADDRSRIRPARAVGPAFGGVGGALLAVWAELPGWHLTGLAAALGVMAVAAVSMGVVGLGHRVPRVWLAVGVAAAVVLACAVWWEWRWWYPALVVLAVAPALARNLPSMVFRVEEEALLEFDRLAATAWSARPRPVDPRRRVRIDTSQVVRQVDDASGELFLWLALIGVLSVGSAAMVCAATWGAGVLPVVLLAGVGAALALSSRSYLRRVERDVLRLSGAVVLGFAGLAVASRVAPIVLIGLVVGLLIVAVVLLALSPLVGRGWTSLTLGRMADALEGLAIVSALPLALWIGRAHIWVQYLGS